MQLCDQHSSRSSRIRGTPIKFSIIRFWLSADSRTVDMGGRIQSSLRSAENSCLFVREGRYRYATDKPVELINISTFYRRFILLSLFCSLLSFMNDENEHARDIVSEQMNEWLSKFVRNLGIHLLNNNVNEGTLCLSFCDRYCVCVQKPRSLANDKL